MNLNDNQLKAVNKVQGPLRIVAGPGSGKTRTIVSKIVHILREGLARPEEILAISFTNKASNEIKERVIADGGYGMRNIYTYHGWCNYFLRVEADALGLNKDFTIIDASDSKSRVKRLIDEFGFDIETKHALEKFEELSREDTSIEKLKASKVQAYIEIAQLYERYSFDKKENGQLDFNDLILQVKNLLTTNEYIRNKWKDKYKYVFIDEFQDTNNIQFEIIRAITNPDSNLTVVGDPDQNIYSWRGANIDIINNFENWYPTAETIFLDTNYRSTPEIIKGANSLIINNKDRVEGFESKPNKSYGANIKFIEGDSEGDEAWTLARTIDKQRREGVNLKDIAIIIRLTYKTRLLESALNNINIPYRVIGAMKFYDRAEVKQTLKFLLFSVKQGDMELLDVINNPPKKFGPKASQKVKAAADEAGQTMWEYLRENKDSQNSSIKDWILDTEKFINSVNNGEDVATSLEEYINNVGYINKLFDEENRVQNIRETIRLVRGSLNKNNSDRTIQGKIIDFYNSALLSSASDKTVEEGEVNIITAHASKGTEFPFVYLYNFVEGHWPSSRAEANNEMEEERRVAYVAATRAMDALTITYSSGYNNFSSSATVQSRFIDEITGFANVPERKTKETTLSTSLSFDGDNKVLNEDPHEIGDRILHKAFGEGTIEYIDGDFIGVHFVDGRKEEILKGHKSYKLI